ncbi:MAG: hypothetical protein AAF609_00840 [Cyanobacteria bacterium P01_C01_bin.120]
MDSNHQLDLFGRQIYALASFNNRYNPLLKLVSISYTPHSFLKGMRGWPVHSTRDSLRYAVALFCSEDHRWYSRATEIVRKIISLQIGKCGHKHYGNWPKYWEEHLVGIYRIDENWASFISTYLIEILILHRNKLPTDFHRKVENSIQKSILYIQNRELSLDYTNIIVNTIYVILVFGEYMEDEALISDGVSLLSTFHSHTIHQQSFSEYNSPNYQVVTLKNLARLRRDVKDSNAQKLICDLYYLAWQNIAENFHPPTTQWSGSHTRSYSTLLKPEVLALLKRSTTESVQFSASSLHPPPDERFLTYDCPSDLEHLFQKLDKPRRIIRTLSCGQRFTTFLTPEFSLGSVTWSDFWHQRNVLIAYWGTPQRPCYLRLRFLHGEQDFSAAYFRSVQKDNKILAGISLATDIDIKNPYQGEYKISQKKILVKDLRLRFEFGGFAEIQQCKLPEDCSLPIILKSENIRFKLRIPYVRFGSNGVQWERHTTQSTTCLDLLLNNSTNSPALFSEMTEAVIGAAVEISQDDQDIADVSIEDRESSLEMKWEELALGIWKKPAPRAILQTLKVDI